MVISDIFAKRKPSLSMIVIFEDKDLEELILTGRNKKYKKVMKVKALMDGVLRAYRIMQTVPNAAMLGQFSYLHYEKLKHQLAGHSSVRVANGYVERIIFIEEEGGIRVKLIELDDTHYGNKK